MKEEKRPPLWFEECETEENERFEDIGKNFGRGLPGRMLKLPFKIKVMPVGLINTNKDLLLRAKLPGFSKDEIRLKVTPRMVYISAQKSKRAEKKQENLFENKVSSESTSRILQLPAKVKADKVKTRFKDGMLEIVMEKEKQED